MAYRMTAARRAALRKAQLASARKRRGRGKSRPKNKNRRKALIAGGAVVAGGLAYAGGRYALNNPKKFGGLGSKMDTAITTGYYYANYPKFKLNGISLQQELDAHRNRSGRTVQTFLNVKKLYRQGRLKNKRDKIIYREYVKQRAKHRLRRIKGEKTVGFSRRSGKALNNLKKQLRKSR